jgi:hypothetical protein
VEQRGVLISSLDRVEHDRKRDRDDGSANRSSLNASTTQLTTWRSVRSEPASSAMRTMPSRWMRNVVVLRPSSVPWRRRRIGCASGQGESREKT